MPAFGVAAVLALIALLVAFFVWRGQAKVGKKKMGWVIGIALLIAGVAGLQHFEVIDIGAAAAGAGLDDGVSAKKINMKAHKFITQDPISGSRTVVAGTVKVYEEDDDPTNPTTSAVDSVTLGSGTGTINNTAYTTGVRYRLIRDGDTNAAGNYYSVDYGVVVFDANNYEAENGLMVTDLSKLIAVGKAKASYKIGTLDDMIDEQTNSTDLNGGNMNVSGSANCDGAELCSGAADTLIYDESVGDGTFYFKPTFAVSGSQGALVDAALCFDFSDSNGAEGNEVTAFTSARQTGNEIIGESNLLNFWSNRECVSLDDDSDGVLKAGVSTKYTFTITVSETNLDTNDGWVMYYDDLGEKNGKDVGIQTGAALDSITFDAVA